VLITCPHLQRTIDAHRAVFAERGIEIVLPPLEQQLSEEELLELIPAFDGAIAGDDPYSARVLERGTRLRVVAKWGIGLDAIDLEAAARLGIQVSNTPGAFGDEVADVVFGYLVMLARGLHRMDASVRAGGWLKVEGTSLRGKTLGVIGVGDIGRAVVRRAAAFGLRPLGYDPQPPPESFQAATGVELLELDALLGAADVVVLCCNLHAGNQGLLGAPELGLLKPGAFLINTARGPLVDEAALVEALRAGRLGGAALDVFETEPLPSTSPLLGFENVILGTHNASNTREAVARVNELAIQNLLAGLEQPRGGTA
jgi:D-3-phosphoglycerate dehydrogenase